LRHCERHRESAARSTGKSSRSKPKHGGILTVKGQPNILMIISDSLSPHFLGARGEGVRAPCYTARRGEIKYTYTSARTATRSGSTTWRISREGSRSVSIRCVLLALVSGVLIREQASRQANPCPAAAASSHRAPDLSLPIRHCDRHDEIPLPSIGNRDAPIRHCDRHREQAP